MSYTPTIGLEIHAELKTQTKMFCNSKNDPDETSPNVNVCPICMAHPGTLPVVNKQAVHHVLRMGAAINGTLADYTEFDRKNYFYPDLPKGYQISQYQFPLVSGGELRGVAITRIHLEEDTARSQHESGEYSLVDFNRAGIPLMELVTEPCIHDSKTAKGFAEELQLLLRTLGAGEANMEKGQMRVEANISVSKTEELGTKVEVKNLNSFRSVERAIEYEIKRQVEVIERGEKVIQETRGWDENKGETFSQRLKESSHDYRYFPDPDIPKFRLSRIAEFSNDSIVKSLPELPSQKRERLIAQGIDERSAEVLVSDPIYSIVYVKEVELIKNDDQRKIATNMLLTTVRGLNPSEIQIRNLNGTLDVAAKMRAEGHISSIAASSVITEILKSGGDFRAIADAKGLLQVHDISALESVVAAVIDENRSVVEEVRGGKEEALKFLVGQGMKKSKGAANPTELTRIFKEKIQAA